MAITIKALGNYSKVPFIYVNSGNPVEGTTGVSAELNDVITLYSEVHPSYTAVIYGFYAIKKEGSVYDYTQLSPTETTPGQAGTGFKKAYTVDSTMISFVEDGYEIYAIPEVDLSGIDNLYDFDRVGYYSTPSAIKNITKSEQGLVYYNTEANTYTEYFFANLFLSQFKVLANSLIYFRTITDPITEGDYAGYSVVFDSYGSAPAGITQPNLVFDEARFELDGYSVNKLPANTYIDMGTPEYGYSPQVILKYGSAPAPTEFVVTFDSNGGSEVASQTVESGETATEPTAPTKEGADFVYWCSDEELTTEYDFDTPVTADITLYAKWNNRQNTVTFKEGDETIATVKVDDLTTVKPIDPKHSIDANGDEFVYWTLNGTEYDFSTPVDNDITLVAYYAQGANDKWIMSLPNCFVGLKSDVDELPIARVENGTKALAISESDGEETAYIFHRASLTWIELQHYTVMI